MDSLRLVSVMECKGVIILSGELQNVMPKAIESLQQAQEYAFRAEDTTYAYYCMFNSIGLHALQGNYIPLMEDVPKLVQNCLEYGDTLLAIYRAVGYAWFYLQNNRITEADSMLALYDRYNGRPYPIYYGTKGEAHLAHGRLDSAESYFRKELEATDRNNRQTGVSGAEKGVHGAASVRLGSEICHAAM